MYSTCLAVSLFFVLLCKRRLYWVLCPGEVMLNLLPRFFEEGSDWSCEIKRVVSLPAGRIGCVRDLPRFSSCADEASKR